MRGGRPPRLHQSREYGAWHGAQKGDSQHGDRRQHHQEHAPVELEAVSPYSIIRAQTRFGFHSPVWGSDWRFLIERKTIKKNRPLGEADARREKFKSTLTIFPVTVVDGISSAGWAPHGFLETKRTHERWFFD